MSQLLSRLSLHPARFTGGMLACLLLLWALVLACAFSSLASRPFSKKQRMFWTVFIICVPLLGLLCYLPFSFNKDNYPFLLNWQNKK
jgi:Phospholipase_D-nuclease N-terminal